jgi:hypothetical protein
MQICTVQISRQKYLKIFPVSNQTKKPETWTIYTLNYQLLYAFFWVIPRRLNFIRRRFGTLCLFYLDRRVGILHTYPPIKIEQCSETSAYKIQTPGNYPEESIQHSEHGGTFKSRIISETSKIKSSYHHFEWHARTHTHKHTKFHVLAAPVSSTFFEYTLVATYLLHR